MNSLKVPESGLLLDGSSERDPASPLQAFLLTLGDDAVESLIQSARDGEHLHLDLGSSPTLHYGSRSHHISPPSDDVPYELYLTKPFESTRKAERLPHAGSLFKKLRPSVVADQKTTSAKASKAADSKMNMASSSSKCSTSSGLDSDIEALQNGLAAHDAARDRARVVEKLPASRKASEKVKSRLWAANNNSTPKSMATSPAPSAAHSPSSTPALSVSQQAVERKKEQRVVLVHELAVEARTAEYLRAKWTGKEEEFQPTLERMAEFSPETKKWAMKKACWKELDVWNFDYSRQEDRQTAINNAVRQYDKQRLSSSEAEWQRLLPVEERGRGKCLSRLQANLAKGPAPPAPKAKVRRTDDSSGSKDDGDNLDSDKAKAGGENMSRSSSTPLSSKPPKKPTAQEAQAKRLLGNSKSRSATNKTSPTKVKAGGKASGSRVLSVAIIENSDSSGDEASDKKAKSAGPTKPRDTVIVKTNPLPNRQAAVKQQKPKQQQQPVVAAAAAKRPREDDVSSSSSETPLSKRVKPKMALPAPGSQQRPQRPLNGTGAPSRSAGKSSSFKAKNTSPTKSSPLASSPPTNASDLDEDSRPVLKKRKAQNESKQAPAAKRRMVESVPTEVLTKAHKFKAYYQKYEALHYEIAALDDPPHQKLADLLDMRDRLQLMKKEIYKQCTPDTD